MLGYFVFCKASGLACSALIATCAIPKFTIFLTYRPCGNFDKHAQGRYRKAGVSKRLVCNKITSMSFIKRYGECNSPSSLCLNEDLVFKFVII